MPSAAAISYASRNAKRSQGRHGVSEEETTPLNDYEDIENPFKMPDEVSKFDKKCVQECLTKTIIVVIIIIIGMLEWMGLNFFMEMKMEQNNITVPWFPNNNISEQ